MRIALAQIDTTVGDLDGNAAKILEFATAAQTGKTPDLVVFPELAITGYPPRDFVEKNRLSTAQLRRLQWIVNQSAALELGILVGYVARTDRPATPAQNAAASVHIADNSSSNSAKCCCRTTMSSTKPAISSRRNRNPSVYFPGVRIALVICEDAWNDKQYWPAPRYRRDPVEELIRHQGADLVITSTRRPSIMEAAEQRIRSSNATAKRFRAPVIYVNQLGGNDQLVFDGSSFAV